MGRGVGWRGIGGGIWSDGWVDGRVDEEWVEVG